MERILFAMVHGSQMFNIDLNSSSFTTAKCGMVAGDCQFV
jgi:hypothetical protein